MGVPRFGDRRPEFYRGLRREDELAVWKFIEENYLLKYKDFLRIEFEWSAEGLWRIPFPGSVRMGDYRSPADYGMPEPLAARVLAWQAALDHLEIGEENPNHQASNAEGLEVAKQVKLFLGDCHYVEFRPFREISIRDGEAVELGVPAFVTDLTR